MTKAHRSALGTLLFVVGLAAVWGLLRRRG